jgi:hypothetical protein
MAKTTCYLGLNKKLRNGGRYGIPSTFIKNLTISDVAEFRGWMDLLMKTEDKKTWEYVYNFTGQISSVNIGVTKTGIDYAAVTIYDKGNYLPFTIFLYETPEHKLNLYCPERGNLLYKIKGVKDRIPDLSQIDLSDYDTKKYLSQVNSSTGPVYGLGGSGENFKKAVDYHIYSWGILDDTHPDRKDWIDISILDLYNNNVHIGPDKITINLDGNEEEYVLGMSYMIEDFESRVVQKTPATSRKTPVRKPKPVIGGAGKELLIVHDDAASWLSRLFGYKTKGVFTKMSQNNPDVPTLDDLEFCDYPIYQFDKGTLYEKVMEDGTDRAVWRCDEFDDYLGAEVIEKIKMLYPGIAASDIFMSDQD